MNSLEVVRANFKEAAENLETFLSSEENMSRIVHAAEIMTESVRGGGKLISCGNGGSMCDAMHFAEELTGRFRENRSPVPAISISDASHITCTGNDFGFEHIFSRFIDAFGKPGDVLLAISTSGNSQNVLNAAISAKRNGMKVIGLTGRDGGKLAALCNVEIRSPFSEYADRVQEIHIKVIHSLIHCIELNLSA